MNYLLVEHDILHCQFRAVCFGLDGMMSREPIWPRRIVVYIRGVFTFASAFRVCHWAGILFITDFMGTTLSLLITIELLLV